VFFDDFDPEGRRILVVGTLRDPEEMLAALRADEFDLVFACTAPSPRGVPAADVADAARRLGCDDVYVFDTVEAACERAMEYADGDDASWPPAACTPPAPPARSSNAPPTDPHRPSIRRFVEKCRDSSERSFAKRVAQRADPGFTGFRGGGIGRFAG
jgi:hypothetical protein